MRITEFKEGDLITRTDRTDRKFGGGIGLFGLPASEPMGDGSFIGDKLLFIGIEVGNIFYKHIEGIFKGDKLSTLPMSDWDDNNWDYYPEAKIKAWEEKYMTPKEKKPIEGANEETNNSFIPDNSTLAADLASGETKEVWIPGMGNQIARRGHQATDPKDDIYFVG